jgi:hypothetical protein
MSTNPAFSVLITAAGGPGEVNAYCTSYLASAAPGRPAHPTTAHTSPAPKPATKPAPTHKPHPTQAQNTKSHPPTH